MLKDKRQEPISIKGKASRIPHFSTVEEEAAFWDSHSITDFDDELEEVTDVHLIVTRSRNKKALTVRLPEDIADRLADYARSKGVAPSTLAKLWIAERLHKETRKI